MGGTKIHAAQIRDGQIIKEQRKLIHANGRLPEILMQIDELVRSVWDDEVKGIGFGVPSVLDREYGIVYDVQNIPSWQEVPLKAHLEQTFDRPAFIENDANCFALGELHFGQGRGYENLAGVVLGTGMAAGIIIDQRLYAGKHGGAGEFGMLPYRHHDFEHYCSGRFFVREYGERGEQLASRAARGDEAALDAFHHFGIHLGHAINALRYALDPDLIILGGSVSRSYDYFCDSMLATMRSIAYRNMAEDIRIVLSQDKRIPVMGSAALCYDQVLDR